MPQPLQTRTGLVRYAGTEPDPIAHHEAMHAALEAADQDKNRKLDAINEDLIAQTAWMERVNRTLDGYGARLLAIEAAPLTNGNEMAPFLVASLRGLLAAIIAGGSTALAAAQMPGVDGRYALLAGATAALGAFASRAGLEGMIDQKAANNRPPAPPVTHP